MPTKGVDELLAEVRRYGQLELKGGAVTVTGRFPRRLLDELKERRDEVRRALALPLPESPLLAALDNEPAVSTLRLTLRETPDIDGDVALMRRLVALFEAHPGGNRASVAICRLDGSRRRVVWRCAPTALLRRAVGRLLAEHAGALGLMVRDGRCRRCDSQELAYEVVFMRRYCVACRLAAWQKRTETGHDGNC